MSEAKFSTYSCARFGIHAFLGGDVCSHQKFRCKDYLSNILERTHSFGVLPALAQFALIVFLHAS